MSRLPPVWRACPEKAIFELPNRNSIGALQTEGLVVSSSLTAHRATTTGRWVAPECPDLGPRAYSGIGFAAARSRRRQSPAQTAENLNDVRAAQTSFLNRLLGLSWAIMAHVVVRGSDAAPFGRIAERVYEG